MRRIKILTLIAVVTALFTACEEPIEQTGNNNNNGSNEPDINYTNFKCIKTLEGHSDYVYSVSYSPDGTKVISGSYD